MLVDIGARQNPSLGRVLPEGARDLVQVVLRAGYGKALRRVGTPLNLVRAPIPGHIPGMLQQRAFY